MPLLGIDDLIGKAARVFADGLEWDPLETDLDRDLAPDLTGRQEVTDLDSLFDSDFWLGEKRSTTPTIKQEQAATEFQKVKAEMPQLGQSLRQLEPQKTANFDSWMGDYDNGRIPLKAMVDVDGQGHFMRPDAAQAWMRMVKDARKDGYNITIMPGEDNAYRDFDTQVDLAEEKGLYSKGGLAAAPGTSNHGWGIANDVAEEGRDWLMKHGAKYGFHTIPREPWHWEFKPDDQMTFRPSVDALGRKRAKPKDAKGKGKGKGKEPAIDIVAPSSPLVNMSQALWGIMNEAPEAQPQKGGKTPPGSPRAQKLPVPGPLKNHFIKAARKTGIDVYLLIAVAAVESGGGNTKSITMTNSEGKIITSSAGALGALQLMPGTAQGLGVDPSNPYENVLGGAIYIAQQLDNFDGNVQKALGAYNAGPGNYQVGINNGYAQKVLDVYKKIRKGR